MIASFGFRTSTARGLAASCLVGLIALGGATGVAPSALAQSGSSSASDSGELDQLILDDGKVINGRIIEINDSIVRMKIVVAGISAETTYDRGRVVQIKRAAEASAESAPSSAPKASSATSASTSSITRSVPGTKSSNALAGMDPDAAKLYVVELHGRWGVDVSQTPLEDVFADVDKTFDDLVEYHESGAHRMVVDESVRDKHVVVLKMDVSATSGFNAIFAAEEMAPIVMKEINQKKRRVVFWVELAAGGAAFLPWVSPEIYFTSDGVMGGAADLDEFSTGDELVDEKLIGAFVGAAEGYVIQGGRAEHLPVMHAMLRKQNWLLARFEGGKPVYFTQAPPSGDDDDSRRGGSDDESAADLLNAEFEGRTWVVLSDDGEGDYADEFEFEGNDVLALNAEWADKLGISSGTADTVDDLAFELGVHRNYQQIEEPRGQKLAERWKTQVADAIEKVNRDPNNGYPLGRMWEDLQDLDRAGRGQDARRVRGQKMSLLRKIKGILARYQEVLDPDRQIQSEIDVRIEELRLEALIENARDRDQDRGGGR